MKCWRIAAGGGLLLPALFCFLSSPARAQWVAEASMGRAVYDPVAVRIAAINAALGIRYDNPGRWLYLSGGKALDDNGPTWGAGGAGGRVGRERNGVWIGVEMGGHFFRYSETTYTEEDGLLTQTEPAGGGATLEAAPALKLRRDRWGLELSTGLIQSWTRISNVDNSLIAADGAAVLTTTPRPGVEIGAVARYLLLPEGGYPHLGGSVQLSRGIGSVWVFGGRWLTDLMEEPRTGYGVGGRVSLGEETGILASWQQEPSDPIYASTPRRTWSVRVTRMLGTRGAPVPPVDVPRPADGLVPIRLPLSAADAAPFVLGDFTEWKPVAMTRVGEFWEVRLPIPSGVHRYGFRSADGSWFVPESLPRADDGMGGESAVLVVP